MSETRRNVDLAPADYIDPVIEAYKKDVDRTLLRENLKLTVQERFEKFEKFAKYVHELRQAGQRSRAIGVLMNLVEIATVSFKDLNSNDQALAIVRADKGVLALCLSVERGGDIEVIFEKAEFHKLLATLQLAVKKVDGE
jgi:hypothetical protein